MKLSQKLDALQAMAKKCAQEPHKMYFIGLLAEHAEEADITADFLMWAGSAMEAPSSIQEQKNAIPAPAPL